MQANKLWHSIGPFYNLGLNLCKYFFWNYIKDGIYKIDHRSLDLKSLTERDIY